MNEETYWNGEPCDAKRIEVIVGRSPGRTYCRAAGQKNSSTGKDRNYFWKEVF